MEQTGYRAGARPDVYDPTHRVRCCDACGAGFVAGESERVHVCDACRHEQEIPEARDVSVPASPAGDESERLTRLAAQLDHEWLIPQSVARFGGNVLEEEVGEARVLWTRLRKRVEEEPDRKDAVVELICVAFALHAALPAQTRAERLARRGIAESSAEAVEDPATRQKLLYNLVIGAIRCGELDHARAWLTRLDPRSPSLDADSSYRVLAAALATARHDPTEVLKILGRADAAIPIHRSSRGLAAVLRASALEKLGNLDAAVDCLYAEMLHRHSALAHMSELVQTLPSDWGLCERSLPIARERDKDRLAENVPAQAGPTVLFVVLGVALVGVAVVLWEEGWTAALVAGSLGLACAAAALVVGIRDFRRRLGIVRGSVPVRGRILAMRRVDEGVYALDVTVERQDRPDERVTTLQPLNSRIRGMKLEGCSFDALWNPAYPTLFPRMTISVSGEEANRAKREG